jgi:hypothetical protein
MSERAVSSIEPSSDPPRNGHSPTDSSSAPKPLYIPGARRLPVPPVLGRHCSINALHLLQIEGVPVVWRQPSICSSCLAWAAIRRRGATRAGIPGPRDADDARATSSGGPTSEGSQKLEWVAGWRRPWPGTPSRARFPSRYQCCTGSPLRTVSRGIVEAHHQSVAVFSISWSARWPLPGTGENASDDHLRRRTSSESPQRRSTTGTQHERPSTSYARRDLRQGADGLRRAGRSVDGRPFHAAVGAISERYDGVLVDRLAASSATTGNGGVGARTTIRRGNWPLSATR